MLSEAYSLLFSILGAVLLAILVSAIVGLLVGNGLAKPIHALTDIIGQTAKLELTSSDSGQGIMEQKDEIGQKANGVLMRSLPDPARCARLMSRATGNFRMREKQSRSSSGSPVSSAGERSRKGGGPEQEIGYE